ncbi:MAG: hypothetical protein QXS21_06010 [Thermoproteota archaeon]|uniref:hypothetical protein n=1 Tax=Saccharolobus sp. TaxID=2100761 RepID=UPI00315F226D
MAERKESPPSSEELAAKIEERAKQILEEAQKSFEERLKNEIEFNKKSSPFVVEGMTSAVRDLDNYVRKLKRQTPEDLYRLEGALRAYYSAIPKFHYNPILPFLSDCLKRQYEQIKKLKKALGRQEKLTLLEMNQAFANCTIEWKKNKDVLQGQYKDVPTQYTGFRAVKRIRERLYGKQK